MNATAMIPILGRIGQALRPWQDRVIRWMDVASSHRQALMASACRAAGLVPVIIPTSMTSLLQPLDTHCSAKYKRHLTQEHEKVWPASPTGGSTTAGCLEALFRLNREILLGTDWAPALRQCVFGGGQGELARTVHRSLDWTPSLSSVSSDPPSLH